MPQQANNWSCAACALAWIERATGLSESASEISAIQEIGYPTHINATYGLMSSSGRELQRVLAENSYPSLQKWVTFDELFAIAEQTTAAIGGGNWYHWVAVRGVMDNNIWIANSALGYRGMYELLTRDDFNKLGPFSCVYLI
jgi:hypothetical protein